MGRLQTDRQEQMPFSWSAKRASGYAVTGLCSRNEGTRTPEPQADRRRRSRSSRLEGPETFAKGERGTSRRSAIAFRRQAAQERLNDHRPGGACRDGASAPRNRLRHHQVTPVGLVKDGLQSISTTIIRYAWAPVTTMDSDRCTLHNLHRSRPWQSARQ